MAAQKMPSISGARAKVAAAGMRNQATEERQKVQGIQKWGRAIGQVRSHDPTYNQDLKAAAPVVSPARQLGPLNGFSTLVPHGVNV